MGFDLSSGEAKKRRLTQNFFKNNSFDMNWQIEKIVSDRDEKEVEETIKLRKILLNIDLPGKIKCKLNTAELVELCRDVRYCFRKKGDRVCSEGEKDDRMYLILRGRV